MDVTSENYTEQLVFFYVIRHYEIATQYKPEYFAQERLRKLFKVIKPYILDYREEPSLEMVCKLISLAGLQTEMTYDVLASLWRTRDQLKQYQDDWLKMLASGYGTYNNLIYTMSKIHSYMMTEQYNVTPETAGDFVEKIKTMFDNDTNFNLSTSVGHDFFDPDEHAQTIVEKWSTGYKFVDQCLNGGYSRGTLNVFMGPPKSGKSMWLCNLCANSIMNGDNSLYVTLEMSHALVAQRIGSNLFNIPIKEYEMFAHDKNRMTEKMRALHSTSLKPLGALVIEEFPTSTATVYDIEALIMNIERARSTPDKPFKFKNIFVDYINIMADAKHASSENTYIRIKNISEGLRAMAQRLDVAVISLTQTNRSAYGASDVDMSSVSESAGIAATVDSLFGIISTPMMKAEGVYYLKGISLRSSSHTDDRKRFKFSGDYLRITEDPTEDIIQAGMPIPGESSSSSNKNGNYSQWKPKETTPVQPITPPEPALASNPLGNLSLGEIEMNMGNNLFNI